MYKRLKIYHFHSNNGWSKPLPQISTNGLIWIKIICDTRVRNLVVLVSNLLQHLPVIYWSRWMTIFVTAVIERNFDQVASCLENTKNWGKFCYEDVLKRRSLTEENYIRGKHLFKFTINKEWPSWTVLNSLFRSKPGLFFAKLSKFFYLWQPWKELDDKKRNGKLGWWESFRWQKLSQNVRWGEKIIGWIVKMSNPGTKCGGPNNINQISLVES